MVSLHAAVAVLLFSGAGQNVMLDFYADWCAPCKAMSPTVQALEQKGYSVKRINIERNPELAKQFNVTGVPCFVMIVDGKEVDRVSGGTTFSRLERMCKMTGSPRLPGGNETGLAQDVFPSAPPMNASRVPSQNNLAANIPTGNAPADALPFAEDANVIHPASYDSATGSRQPIANVAFQQPQQQGMSRQFDPSQGMSPQSLDAALTAASVRLRVEDPDGNSCGSGTIIDSRAGEALILTCGHIFRDSKGVGKIEVDFFGPNVGQRIVGRLISYDLKRDVGIVAVRTPFAVAAARLAPPGYKPKKGDAVISIGCDNGADATVRHSRVTSLDRYQGPANIQVAGQPTEGRSGGGLFSADGMVIGVCNARDPQDQEGLFAAIEPIIAQMDQAGLAFVYNQPQGSLAMQQLPSSQQMQQMPQGQQPIPAPASFVAQQAPQQDFQTPAAQMGDNVAAASFNSVAQSAVQAPVGGMNSDESAAMDEIRRQLKDGAEVVCIIRPRNKPNAASEVIMLDKASPEFVRQLSAAAKPKDNRQLTSLEVAKPRKTILEWSSEQQPARK